MAVKNHVGEASIWQIAGHTGSVSKLKALRYS
jgi:hypothetical protein